MLCPCVHVRGCQCPWMPLSLDGSMCSHLAIDGAHGGGDAQDGIHVADLHIAVDCGAVPLQLCSTKPNICHSCRTYVMRRKL